jgi:hypothetical protein
VIDQEVAGDRDQPGADSRPLRVEALPGAQRAFKALLREVLGVVTASAPIGEEAVNAIEMVVVCLFEIQGAWARGWGRPPVYGSYRRRDRPSALLSLPLLRAPRLAAQNPTDAAVEPIAVFE